MDSRASLEGILISSKTPAEYIKLPFPWRASFTFLCQDDDNECVDGKLHGSAVAAAAERGARASSLGPAGDAAGHSIAVATTATGRRDMGRLDDGPRGRRPGILRRCCGAHCGRASVHCGDNRTVRRWSARLLHSVADQFVAFSEIRGEAVHLRGVDNLSTDDITTYMNSVYPDVGFVKLEWIDDTSLNIVYESADIAITALQALTAAHIEYVPSTTLRPAKPSQGEKPIDGLKVRIAFVSDKKERGARDRSRWYLFNPHPSEEYEGR